MNLLKKILYAVVILFFVAHQCDKHWQESNKKPLGDENTEEIVEPRTFEITNNKCNICNNDFKGRGYTEKISGVWVLTQAPYQSYICSKSCGLRHTNRMKELVGF